MITILSVVMLLAGSVASRIVRERQQIRRHFVEAQAVRLAESGLARGRARLADDAGFTGEVWEIPAAAWLGGASARIEITIEPIHDSAGFRLITSQAVYPLEREERVQRTRSARIRI